MAGVAPQDRCDFGKAGNMRVHGISTQGSLQRSYQFMWLLNPDTQGDDLGVKRPELSGGGVIRGKHS